MNQLVWMRLLKVKFHHISESMTMNERRIMRNELKRLAKQDQSEFSHKYACWANNHNGWSKMKKLNRKLAKKRLRRLLNGELDD